MAGLQNHLRALVKTLLPSFPVTPTQRNADSGGLELGQEINTFSSSHRDSDAVSPNTQCLGINKHKEQEG